MAKRKQPKSAPAAKTIKKSTVSARDAEPKRAAEVPQAPISPPTDDTDETESAIFPIVGIGASAGGLEAFTELLQNLPANTGMGFVLVPHLDPKHVSLLTELLRRHTSMPVQDATNGVEVQPNQIYIIPRDTHMTLVRGSLMLSPRQGTPTAHMPIDPFLRSLAADRQGRAIGVILSGNASDGTLGMMAIKAAGGITFAQSTESAKYDSMPRSAAAAGCIDFVLPPKEIAKELARLPQHPYIAPVPSEAEGEVAGATTEAIGRILILLRNATGVDFTYYKPTTLRRRILRRMALRRIDSLDQYFTQLRSNPAEVNALYEDILINVTEFFRDPEVFDTLKTVVFPKIVLARNDSVLRIWVPGCASGEEVYSIAIALLEFLGERSSEVPIQIFGTDISDVALEKARSATYASGLVEGISSERLRRFFTKTDSTYVVAKRIREMCVFAKQNLIKDPPFSKIDLISCRNVMIYLGHVLQKRLIPMFHYALKPNGFLLLGTSETTGNSELFSAVDKKNKIYERVPGSENLPLQPAPEEAAPQPPVAQRFPPDWSEAESSREADRIVLGNYAPCGVVVDNSFNVVQFRGRTSAYLENPSGVANLNVLAMAREGLLSELRSALYRARRESTAVRREGLRVQRDTGFAVVNFEVIPFKGAPGRENRYLVLFDEARVLTLRAEKKSPKKRLSPKALERENDHLRQELAASKEYLQSVVEQHDTANEELRSANEEIQSSNEELQSTNEELETAKEELQSTNEELNTVNEELQVRNLQLAQTGNDLNNLLSNVNIPIIMVSNDLRIRRFTPVSQRILNLIPTDVGRPISDININLDVPRLDRLLLEVIESLAPQTLQVNDSAGRPYSLRIRPYRTEDNRIDGAVIVLVDLDPERLLANSIQAVEGLPQPADGTQEMNDTLRAFSAGLMVAQERERRNLAVELHDDITQRLALLELGLESLQRTPPKPDELSVQLKMLEAQVTDLSDRMRHVAQQLHPSMVDDLGLVPALESLVREFNNQQEIEVTFQHDSVPGRLDPNAGLCLYRVVQEALHNIVKHSGGKSAQIRLKGIDGNAVKLSILDTGIGFEPNGARGKGRLGLRSMEERVRFLGGTFQIQSQPGKGTEVTVTVPQSTAGKDQAQRA